MIKDSEYNRAHNALSTLKDCGDSTSGHVVPLTDGEYHTLELGINSACNRPELAVLVGSIHNRINVNSHMSKADMVKFAKSKGYRPLSSDDVSDAPLQKYVYQLPSGYYRSVYLVKV